MKEIIERLERELKDLKKAYEKEEREAYKKQDHKIFKIGDYVKKGDRIGVIQRADEKNEGLCYISIINGNGGGGNLRSDEWDLITGDESKYLSRNHLIELNLTGGQIEALITRYRHVNKNQLHDEFMSILKDVRNW